MTRLCPIQDRGTHSLESAWRVRSCARTHKEQGCQFYRARPLGGVLSGRRALHQDRTHAKEYPLSQLVVLCRTARRAARRQDSESTAGTPSLEIRPIGAGELHSWRSREALYLWIVLAANDVAGSDWLAGERRREGDGRGTRWAETCGPPRSVHRGLRGPKEKHSPAGIKHGAQDTLRAT
jgi:hypothetical protein